MSTPRTLFIVNPAAGAGRARNGWTAFRPELPAALRPQDILFTRQPGDGTRIARELAGRYDLVMAAGGDGTACEVASGILSSGSPQTALGLIPLGTANDVAHTVHLHTMRDAARALQRNRTRLVDVIEVRCRVSDRETVHHALLFAAVGIAGDLLRRTTPMVKRLFGRRWAYPVGLLRALWSYRPPLMRVQCDEQSFADRFLFVAASNTECAGGGMRFAPGARADDGLLNVNLIQAINRWRAFAEVRRLCRGQHLMRPEVRYFTACRLRIETDPPIGVQADGDLVGTTPARFEIRPNALRLLAP